MCFGIAAFDTYTFQLAILYQNEGHLTFILRYNIFVCRVNGFRVMIDFERDPNKFQILLNSIYFREFSQSTLHCLFT